MNRKILALVLAACLLLGTLAGCTPGEGTSDPSVPGESESGVEGQDPGPDLQEVAGADLPIGNPDTFLLYRYYSDLMLVSEPLFTPVPRQVGNSISAGQLYEMVQRPGENRQEYAFTLEVEDGTATFYLAGDRALGKDQEDMLYTLWATLVFNDTGVGKVRFLYNGRPLDAYAIQLDSEGYVTESENIPVPEQSMEELAALRATVDYAYPEQVFTSANLGHYLFHDDPTGRELANFIQAVTRWNIPLISFSSIEEADPGFVVMAAMLNTEEYYWYTEMVDDYVRPDLEPLAYTSGDYQGRMQEHVERTAKLLFGDAVPFVHQSAGSHWRYMEYAGVYIPPHMGIYGVAVPVILEYEELDDRYEATVAYLTWHMEMNFINPFGHPITDAEARRYVLEDAPRHHITIGKDGQGGLVYQAHQLPEEGYEVSAAIWELPTERLTMDTLVSIRSYGLEDFSEDLYGLYSTNYFLADNPGVNFEIIPTYVGSTVRLERLDPESGEAVEVLYEATAESGYLLQLQAQEEETAPRLRLVVEYGGRTAVYDFLTTRAFTPDGVLALGPIERLY